MLCYDVLMSIPQRTVKKMEIIKVVSHDDEQVDIQMTKLCEGSVLKSEGWTFEFSHRDYY